MKKNQIDSRNRGDTQPYSIGGDSPFFPSQNVKMIAMNLHLCHGNFLNVCFCSDLENQNTLLKPGRIDFFIADAQRINMNDKL